MFMITPSPIIDNCYSMGAIDASTGGSKTQLMTNIWEAATILDSWETVLPKAKTTLSVLGLDVDDVEAETNIKHFYQCLRHGLSFDWVLNHVTGKVLDAFPFCRLFKFGKTGTFMDKFKDDPIFVAELSDLDMELQKVFDWVFEDYPDRTVYARLAASTGTINLEEALFKVSITPEDQQLESFLIPVRTSYRVNYLTLLLEMIAECLGFVRRDYWTEAFEDIAQQKLDAVLVVGGKFQAFAYGFFDGDVCWKNLDGGIKMLGLSDRQQRTEYVRAFPDQMTFFRIQDNILYVDETMFPQVSFDDGESWFTSNAFSEAVGVAEADIAKKMKVRYPFPPKAEHIGKKTIKLVAGLNCVIKDATVVLDENNEAETQIMFRSTHSELRISDTDKAYPMSFFATKNVSITSLAWL